MKEDKPLVSFILTYYNLPVGLLCQSIDSILRLSLRPFEREIIVVDDGSDSSPMNDLLRYGSDIIYVRKHNGGVSTARNQGLLMAQGRFIQFIDGDDYLIQAPYEHCLDIIRYQKQVDVVCFDFTHDATTQAPSFNDDQPISGSDLLRTRNLQCSVCCCLFRQSVRGNLAFTPGISYGEDEEFTPQLLLRATSVLTTDAKAYYYRQHAASAVHQTDGEHIAMRLDQNLTVIRHLNQLTDRLPAADKPGIQRRVAQLTMDYLYNTIVLTRSSTLLAQRIEQLSAEGLFPLPDKDYSAKYSWFRRIVNSEKGRRFLIAILPRLKRER
jgi:hypothetical protein